MADWLCSQCADSVQSVILQCKHIGTPVVTGVTGVGRQCERDFMWRPGWWSSGDVERWHTARWGRCELGKLHVGETL